MVAHYHYVHHGMGLSAALCSEAGAMNQKLLKAEDAYTVSALKCGTTQAVDCNKANLANRFIKHTNPKTN
jgi:hypothetical protein